MKSKTNLTFKEEKDLLGIMKGNITLKHNLKMEEIQAEKENIILFHNLELKRIELKSKRVKETQERKYG